MDAAKAALLQQPAEAEGAYSGLLEGLRRSPKHLPCSYLYDAAGSQLYERITELEEYYPFRTEQMMLRQHAMDIASYITPGRQTAALSKLAHGSAMHDSATAACYLQHCHPDGFPCTVSCPPCGNGSVHSHRSGPTRASHQQLSELLRRSIAGSVVVELGCGTAQKTGILLNELLARDGSDQVQCAQCTRAQRLLNAAALLRITSTHARCRRSAGGQLCISTVKPRKLGYGRTRDLPLQGGPCWTAMWIVWF